MRNAVALLLVLLAIVGGSVAALLSDCGGVPARVDVEASRDRSSSIVTLATDPEFAPTDGKASEPARRNTEQPLAARPVNDPWADLESGWCTLRVLGEDSLPVFPASVVLGGDVAAVEHVNRDGELRLRLDSATNGGLVVAGGFHPQVFEVWPGDVVVRLQRDAGLPVCVYWKDDGAPVQGATIRRCFSVSRLGWLPPVFRELIPDPRPTDTLGRAHVQALAVVEASSELRHGLEIEHPEATTLFVASQTIPIPATEGGAVPPLEVGLSRKESTTPLTLRLVHASGEPVRERPLRLRIHDLYAIDSRTNAEGEVRLRLDVHERLRSDVRSVSVDADLGDGRWWLGYADWPQSGSGEQLLRVDFPAVRGRVLHPSPEDFELASAALSGSVDADVGVDFLTIVLARPAGSQLAWGALDATGRFDLPEGWRGEQTVALVRHRASGAIVGGALVDGGEVTVDLSGVALATLHARSVEQREHDWTLRLRIPPECYPAIPFSMESPHFELTTTRPDIELPAGTYDHDVVYAGLTYPLGKLVVEPGENHIEVSLPELTRVRGLARSTLRGPLPAVELQLAGHGWFLRHIVTDSAGRFVARVPRAELETMRSRWAGWEVQPEHLFSEAGEDDGVLVLLRRESRLRVTQDPSSPLAGRLGIRVRSETSGAEGTVRRHLHGEPDDTLEALGPPGRYSVRQGEGPDAFNRIVDLADAETVDVWASAPDAALLELRIEVPRDMVGEARGEIRRGTERIHELESSLDGYEPTTCVFDLSPGSYTVRIEAVLAVCQDEDSPPHEIPAEELELALLPGEARRISFTFPR